MASKLKLNTWQTIRVGFAFLAILAFWQMYNNVIPLMLTKTFHMDKSFSGAIMAADNILALFLLLLAAVRLRDPLHPQVHLRPAGRRLRRRDGGGQRARAVSAAAVRRTIRSLPRENGKAQTVYSRRKYRGGFSDAADPVSG